MLGAVPRAIEEKRAEDAPEYYAYYVPATEKEKRAEAAPEYYAYYVPATEKEKRASPDFADDIVA